MGEIGIERARDITPRESGQTDARSFMTRRLDQTTKKGKQMTEEPQEGSTGAPFHGVTDWHAIDWKAANHNVRRLQARIGKRNSGKEVGQGQSEAPTLNPLVQRQGSCGTTSDGKPRQKHSRGRQGHLEHSTQEDQRRLFASAKGLPSSATPTHLYTQEKRQKACFKYSRYER